MNIQPSKKYGLSPEEVESCGLKSERFRTLYNMHRIKKQESLTLERTDMTNKKYLKKRKKNQRKLEHW